MAIMNNSKDSRVDESEYIPSSYRKSHARKNRFRPRMAIVLTAILVIIILIGVGYWYHKDHKSNKSKSNNSAQTVIPTAPSNTSSATVQYVSNGNDLNLSFAYPSSWSVTPASNNNPKDQPITVTSPLVATTNASNSQVTGKVIVQIRPASATINELNTNAPVEALASTQIAYSHPTANQFQYPYVSYIHFSNASKVSGAFEEVIITGSQLFSQGQSFSAGDIVDLDPIISASFYQCSTQSCSGSGQTPLSITNNTWQNSAVFQRVLALFESFKFN